MFYQAAFFYADLDAIPTELIVAHTPDRVRAERNGPSGREFTWTHRTSVGARSDTRIIAFGGFGLQGGAWELGNYSGAAFTTENFADWFACPDGKLHAGREYLDPRNWTGGNTLRAGKTKWIFIARKADGRLIKGEAVVEHLAVAEPASH